MALLLMGDQIITLVKHKKTETSDGYACYSLANASWFASRTISTSADGAKPVNTFTVRIPGKDVPTGISPETGDYIVKGVVTSVARPSDLAGREYFRITAVGNNNRGNLPHWRVSGS